MLLKSIGFLVNLRRPRNLAAVCCECSNVPSTRISYFVLWSFSKLGLPAVTLRLAPKTRSHRSAAKFWEAPRHKNPGSSPENLPRRVANFECPMFWNESVESYKGAKNMFHHTSIPTTSEVTLFSHYLTLGGWQQKQGQNEINTSNNNNT